MREQLKALLELQTADATVREIEKIIAGLPSKLDPVRRDLDKLESLLGNERAKLKDNETWRKDHQTAIERENDHLKNAKNKLSASKNGKEFNAANREVDHKRKSITDRESELKKISEAAVTSAAQLETRSKDVEALREQLTGNQAALIEETATMQSKLADAIVTRDAARGGVESSWLKTYDTLSAKRGYAVAPVIKGSCQGCHMALPPQLNNILARLQSIETCPRCGRLVYRQEFVDGGASSNNSDIPTTLFTLALPGLLKELHSLEELPPLNGPLGGFNAYRDFRAENDPFSRGFSFRVFGSTPAGDDIAFWVIRDKNGILEQPVVFLGKDGPNTVLAKNFYDYLWIIAEGMTHVAASMISAKSDVKLDPSLTIEPLPAIHAFAETHAAPYRKTAREAILAARAEFPTGGKQITAILKKLIKK